MARLTYEDIKNLDITSLGEMSKSQVIDLLKQARKKFETRAGQFSKAKNVYSPALEKMEEYYKANGKTAPSRISRNKAINELSNIQDFFKSQTSDLKGARKVMRDQDARIFGVGRTGRPLHRMSIEERTDFWATYNEFLSTYKTADRFFKSDTIQQYLGEMTLKKRGKSSRTGIDMSDITELMDALRKTAEEDEYERGGNVFSGRRSNK